MFKNSIQSKLLQWSTALLILCTGCATTVETTMTKTWEKERIFNSDKDLLFSQMYMTDDGSAVSVVSPGGVQAVNTAGETVTESERGKIFELYISTTRGMERLTEKMTYMYIAHRHALLEFNYARFSESVSYIDLNEQELEWVTKDLKWSLERYQVFARSMAQGFNLGGKMATDAASEVMMPKRFVGNLTQIVPELDALIFKTLDGLSLINLENGEVMWVNKDFKGGLAEVMYDEVSNSLVAVNRDDDAFALEGLQFNKQLMRIDAKTGNTIWESEYDGNIREKLDGVGIWADRTIDIRLVEGNIMINFLNVEVYDFETGEKRWQTSTGSDRMLDLVAPEAQIMNLFAFPEIHNGQLFRVSHENVGLTGVDVVIEAYDYNSGELLWKTDKISRSKPINDMIVADGKLVASTEASEGIIAFDISNGEKLWNYKKFGKNGVQFKMQRFSGSVLAAGSGNVVSLDIENGEPMYAISSSDNGLGDLKDFSVIDNNLIVSGSNGFGSFALSDGSNLSKIKTPTGGVMQVNSGANKVLIQPKPNYNDASYPVDGAYHIINLQTGMLMGTLGTNNSRKAVLVAPDYTHLFVLTNNKIMMYSTK